MCSSPGVGLKDCTTGQAICGLCRLLWSTFSKLRICRMLKSWVKPLVPMAAGADSFLWSKWSLRLGGFIVKMMKLSESEPPFRKHTTWPPARCLTAPSMRGSHFLDVKGTLSLDIAPCPHLTLFLPEWGYSLMSNPWTGFAGPHPLDSLTSTNESSFLISC